MALLASCDKKYVPPNVQEIEARVGKHVVQLEEKEMALIEIAETLPDLWNDRKKNAAEIAKLEKESEDIRAETARMRAQVVEDMKIVINNNLQDPKRQEMMKTYGLWDALNHRACQAVTKRCNIM